MGSMLPYIYIDSIHGSYGYSKNKQWTIDSSIRMISTRDAMGPKKTKNLMHQQGFFSFPLK